MIFFARKILSSIDHLYNNQLLLNPKQPIFYATFDTVAMVITCSIINGCTRLKCSHITNLKWAQNVYHNWILKFELLPYLHVIFTCFDHTVNEALCEWKFASDEVKDMVHTQPQLQLITLFADGIRRLVNCYTILIEKKGWIHWDMIHFALVTDCSTRSN